MKLVKLVFWICVIVILAYFMTDFKFRGKTVKENIDGIIGSSRMESVKKKALQLVQGTLSSSAEEKFLSKPLPDSGQGENEEFPPEDKMKLKKLIEQNQ